MSSKKIELTVASAYFRKWDMLYIGGSKKTAIVLNTKDNDHSHTMTVYPYKQPRYRLFKWLKFTLLRLRVYFGWIK